MANWIDKINADDFESSSGKTKEWRTFYASAKTWWRQFAKDNDLADLAFSEMHFEFSAFFRYGKQWWCVSTGDVRGSARAYGMSIRTVHEPRDSAGVYSRFVAYDHNFARNVLNIIKREAPNG